MPLWQQQAPVTYGCDCLDGGERRCIRNVESGQDSTVARANFRAGVYSDGVDYAAGRGGTERMDLRGDFYSDEVLNAKPICQSGAKPFR
jgi:hypothetical protein